MYHDMYIVQEMSGKGSETSYWKDLLPDLRQTTWKDLADDLAL